MNYIWRITLWSTLPQLQAKFRKFFTLRKIHEFFCCSVSLSRLCSIPLFFRSQLRTIKRVVCTKHLPDTVTTFGCLQTATVTTYPKSQLALLFLLFTMMRMKVGLYITQILFNQNILHINIDWMFYQPNMFVTANCKSLYKSQYHR